MKTPPTKQGKIFADLHCHLHPPTKKNASTLVEKLSSGITGITAVSCYQNVARYEQFVQDLQLTEINSGLLARVEHNGRKGYILKTQEAGENTIGFHILALACQDDIDDKTYSDPKKIIDLIHEYNGLAIITHPFTTVATIDDFLINRILNKRLIKYRFINEEEKEKLMELHPLLDEVEIFNAQNINAIPFILDMTSSNDLAYSFFVDGEFKGIASSDTHFRLEQIQKTGIYLPAEKEAYLLESVLENIKQGNFESYQQYISRPSFIAGMFPIAGKLYDLIPKPLKDN